MHKLTWQLNVSVCLLGFLLGINASEPVSKARLAPAALPVVLWHGMGDSCCASYSLGAVQSHIQQTLDGAFVLSVNTGTSNTAADTLSGFFGKVNDQVDQVCKLIASTPELQQGYNAVGFSQGGQFLRAVLERCQHTGPRMKTLITLGAQHQGIINVPECWDLSFNSTPSGPVTRSICRLMQKIMDFGAYLPWVRDHVVQAQYFKDPARLNEYLLYNHFLPDINNELPDKTEQYSSNLRSLEKLVLVRFMEDVTVVPRDSAWFATYDGQQLHPMEETQLYKEDWIGLRSLDEAGQVVKLDCPGAHMQFSLEWLTEYIIRPYLAASKQRRPVQ